MAVKKTTQADAIMRITHANIHLARGSARAAAVGFDNFVRKLEHANVLSPDININGFVAGAVAGWAAAMQEGAKLAEEAFRIWMNSSETADAPQQPVRKTTRK